MCRDDRAALNLWMRTHFAASCLPYHRCAGSLSAILSSVHVMQPAVMIHDPHKCARSLAAAAVCLPAPHALKFAALVIDAVEAARMQQQALQAQESLALPVCCVAIGNGECSSIAGISRLHCATLTFCRPTSSAAAATAPGLLRPYNLQLGTFNLQRITCNL